jgi:hypothetical protein
MDPKFAETAPPERSPQNFENVHGQIGVQSEELEDDGRIGLKAKALRPDLVWQGVETS